MRYILKWSFCLLTTLALLLNSGCKGNRKANISPEPKKVDLKAEGYIYGTIRTYDVDGCTFMIYLEENVMLNPINLEEKYKVNNLNVWIKYVERNEVNTVCMAGTVIELTAVIAEEK